MSNETTAVAAKPKVDLSNVDDFYAWSGLLARRSNGLQALAWFDSHATIELLRKLRKALPDLPTTSAALDGGCADCGVSQTT
jgi:hypothetical protein